MSAKFYTLLTDIGAAKLANAAALGVPLKITQMAVGDGGGVLPTPNAQQTKLVGEKRRAALNMLYIDSQNSSQVIAEQVIPETEGGWWIREVGLFDETGALIAVGNCPESYKPQLAEGSGRTQTVRMVLITSSTDNITLKIDPSVVLATRKYVDDKVLELKVYVDNLMAAHLAAADPHSQYATKASLTNAMANKQPLDNTLTALSGKSIAAILEYLGLGEGSALPVGIPIPWPSATPPAGWLKCNGATFIADLYPKLALVYPALKLPDLRGEFIRGWDDGRGVDVGRGVLSAQLDALQKMTGTASNGAATGFINNSTSIVTGVFKRGVTTYGNTTAQDPNYQGVDLLFDSSLVARSSTETRPRNVAFNYIVRAA